MRKKLNGKATDFIRVLPTFLHELAHGYREGIRVRDIQTTERKQQSTIGKKKSTINHATHDDKFYECFAYTMNYFQLC